MPVPTKLSDLSTTPASNFPAGSESPSVLDDTLRAHAALMAELRDLNNTGPQGGLRNLIINGNFAINQRGYASGTATSGANQYTLDRWRVVTSGQNATFTASGNGNQVTAPAGGLEQVIEGRSIAGGTYVINWTGTATCTVGGTARDKGATFTLTANTNVTVRFTGGTVAEVQVEPGTVVTPFEARPHGLELALCQRYYCEVGFVMRLSGGLYQHIPFPVNMRASPTFTVKAGSLSGGTVDVAAYASERSLRQQTNPTADSDVLIAATAEL